MNGHFFHLYNSSCGAEIAIDFPAVSLTTRTQEINKDIQNICFKFQDMVRSLQGYILLLEKNTNYMLK